MIVDFGRLSAGPTACSYKLSVSPEASAFNIYLCILTVDAENQCVDRSNFNSFCTYPPRGHKPREPARPVRGPDLVQNPPPALVRLARPRAARGWRVVGPTWYGSTNAGGPASAATSGAKRLSEQRGRAAGNGTQRLETRCLDVPQVRQTLLDLAGLVHLYSAFTVLQVIPDAGVMSCSQMSLAFSEAMFPSLLPRWSNRIVWKASSSKTPIVGQPSPSLRRLDE